MAAPLLVGTPTQYAGFVSGTTKTTPVVATVGDVHYAWIVVSTGSVITTPAGWTLLGSGSFSAAARTWALYTKVSTATGSESPTWSFTGGGTADLQYVLYTTHTVDVQGTIATATATTSVQASAVSPTSSATLLLYFGGLSAARDFTVEPSGMTARSTTVTAVRVHAADQVLTASGTTGTRTATISSSADVCAVMLALNGPASRTHQMVV